jgi:hypothetical protein
MNHNIVHETPNLIRNTRYLNAFYLQQFLFTLSWSVERTALVLFTLNDSDKETVGMVKFATIRILWEIAVVAGGCVAGTLVVWCDMTPALLIKIWAAIGMLCTPLLFYVHIMELSIAHIIASYTLFHFVDGGIKNLRQVLLAQCSPQQQMMRTVGTNMAVKSVAIACGSALSMLVFDSINRPVLLIHMLAATAYAISMITMYTLGTAECETVEQGTETRMKVMLNPVTPQSAPFYILTVLMLLPVAYSVLSFYEIWAASAYDTSTVDLELSKVMTSVVSISASLLFGFVTFTWVYRRWIVVVAQSIAVASLLAIAYGDVSKYAFFIIVAVLTCGVVISALIATAMLYDYLPTSSRALTKWSSVSLLSSLLTRCSELMMGTLIDTCSYSIALSVAAGIGSFITIICIWVARVLNGDMTGINKTTNVMSL